MKTNKAKLIPVLISAAFLLNGATVYAHSNHDRSHMKMKWVFNKKVENRVDFILKTNPNENLIGLTSLEKKVMDRYNLKAGRTFDAEVQNTTYRFERNTTGLKVIKKMPYKNVSLYESIPVNKTRKIVQMGWSQPSHSGHNHSHFPHEWVLTSGIQEKIKNNIKSGNPHTLIGLSSFHQKKMDRYGILPGMTFSTRLNYSPVMVKRTASGVQIVDVIDPRNVAMLYDNSVNKF